MILSTEMIRASLREQPTSPTFPCKSTIPDSEKILSGTGTRYITSKRPDQYVFPTVRLPGLHARLSWHSPAIYWLLAPSDAGSKQFGAFLKQRAGGAVSPDSVLADIDALMVICFKAVLPMLARDRGCFQVWAKPETPP